MLLHVSGQMTPRQALLGILVLCLTARSDADCVRAGDLADEVSSKVTHVDVENCKAIATKVFLGIHEQFHAIASRQGEESMLSFEDEAARDRFLKSTPGAYLPSCDQVSCLLVDDAQRVLEDHVRH